MKEKSRGTQRAFMLSFVSILACCVAFVGVTFAWFSSGAGSSNNRIKAGTLKVRLDKKIEGVYTDISDTANIPVFDLVNFKPGDEVSADLRVVNTGTVDIMYHMAIRGLVADNDGNTEKIEDMIDVFVNGQGAFALSDLGKSEYALISGTIVAGEYEDVAVSVVYNTIATMDGAEVEFDIEVFATQSNNADYVAPSQPAARVLKKTDTTQAAEVSNSVATVALPQNSLPVAATNSNAKVEFNAVMTTQPVEDVTSIDISAGSAVLAAIDLNLAVDGTAVEEFEQAVTVTLNIAPGITDPINVVYNGAYDGNKPEQPFDINYNAETGVLTFKTWHFSAFSVMLVGRMFRFENGNTNEGFIIEPWGGKGAVAENDDNTLTLTVDAAGGPYVSAREVVAWSDKGVTLESDIYIDPAVINGTFGVDTTMRNADVSTNYATERRIAFAKQTSGAYVGQIKVNPAHNANQPMSQPAIYIEEAGWYTAGLSYYKGANDQLYCRMFVLNENGEKIAEWIHKDLAKVNSPSAPDYDGSFNGIGSVGALWFIGNNSSAKLREVRIYQADGTRYEVVSNEEQFAAALAGNADEIFVNNGTYNMQLDIRRNVTIVGQSRDGVIISGPEDYTNLVAVPKRTESRDYVALVTIADCSVTLRNLTVRGIEERALLNYNARLSNTNAYTYVGVLILEANATLDSVSVRGIRLPENLIGMQTGHAIYACMKEGQTFVLTNSEITDIQKTGVLVRSFGTFICDNNIITGRGAEPVVAQNGIQSSAFSVITNTTISGFEYTGPNAERSCAILFASFEAGGAISNRMADSIVKGNTVGGCDSFVRLYKTTGTSTPDWAGIANNTVA